MQQRGAMVVHLTCRSHHHPRIAGYPRTCAHCLTLDRTFSMQHDLVCRRRHCTLRVYNGLFRFLRFLRSERGLCLVKSRKRQAFDASMRSPGPSQFGHRRSRASGNSRCGSQYPWAPSVRTAHDCLLSVAGRNGTHRSLVSPCAWAASSSDAFVVPWWPRSRSSAIVSPSARPG
jgi:hypothetical protein